MFFIVIILSIFVFLKTIGYAIYEYKDNSNKIAGTVIVVLAIIALVGPIIVSAIKYTFLSCFTQNLLFHFVYNFLF